MFRVAETASFDAVSEKQVFVTDFLKAVYKKASWQKEKNVQLSVGESNIVFQCVACDYYKIWIFQDLPLCTNMLCE